MKNYDELREEFEKKVLQLRERCKHEKISEWMRVQWAPGHMTPFEIQQCLICKKQIGKRLFVYNND